MRVARTLEIPSMHPRVIIPWLPRRLLSPTIIHFPSTISLLLVLVYLFHCLLTTVQHQQVRPKLPLISIVSRQSVIFLLLSTIILMNLKGVRANSYDTFSFSSSVYLPVINVFNCWYGQWFIITRCLFSNRHLWWEFTRTQRREGVQNPPWSTILLFSLSGIAELLCCCIDGSESQAKTTASNDI